LCPHNHTHAVAAACEQAINADLRQAFEYEQKAITYCGSVAVTVTSGLVINSVESIGVKCRINFSHLPKRMTRSNGEQVDIDSDTAFKDFLAQLVNVSEIVWTQYKRGNAFNAHSGVAIFASECAAHTACSMYEREEDDDSSSASSSNNASSHGGAMIDGNKKDAWGRTVRWTLAKTSLTEAEALERIRSRGAAVPYTLRCNTFGTRAGQFSVVVKNLPPAYDTCALRTIHPAPLDVFVPSVKHGSQTKMAILNYRTTSERDMAYPLLHGTLSSISVALQLPDKYRGGTFTKNVAVEVSTQDNLGNSTVCLRQAAKPTSFALCFLDSRNQRQRFKSSTRNALKPLLQLPRRLL
jgi:hypothetical protein